MEKGVRGQTAASRSLLKPPNQHNTAAAAAAATQEEPEGGKSGLLLQEDALCNEWLRKSTKKKNQVSTTQI